MKRDARIGMAVVLVLGLSVTLLIAQTLYRKGRGTGELESEVASNANRDERPADASRTLTRPAITDLSDAPATPQTPLPPFQLAQDGQRVDADHETTVVDGARDQRPRRETTALHMPEFYAYTVGANESPWKISSKVYGDGKYTQKIVEANGGMDALKLKSKSGSLIKIPALSNHPLAINLPAYAEVHGPRTTKTPAAASAPTRASGNTYKVGSGENLTAIAKKHYGDTNKKTIDMIVAANKGMNPNALKAGQEIVLPAK